MAAISPIRLDCPRCGEELVIDMTATPGEKRDGVVSMHLRVLEESMRQALDHIRSHAQVEDSDYRVTIEEVEPGRFHWEFFGPLEGDRRPEPFCAYRLAGGFTRSRDMAGRRASRALDKTKAARAFRLANPPQVSS